MQWILGGGIPEAANQTAAPLWMELGPPVPALLALAIRFAVIPKLGQPSQLLPALIIGTALAEATGLLGMLLVDEAYGRTRLIHLAISLVTIALFAPTYFGKTRDSGPYQR